MKLTILKNNLSYITCGYDIKTPKYLSQAGRPRSCLGQKISQIRMWNVKNVDMVKPRICVEYNSFIKLKTQTMSITGYAELDVSDDGNCLLYKSEKFSDKIYPGYDLTQGLYRVKC